MSIYQVYKNMKSTDEYKRYLTDQQEDNAYEPQYRDYGKKVIYKYMDFLSNNLLNQFSFFAAQVLDVGCREFFTDDYFREKYKKSIHGIDIGKEGIEFARSQGKHVAVLDAHEMSKENVGERDLITAFHCMEHFYDLPQVLSNCYDCLKDDGYLYFAVPVPVKNEQRGYWYSIDSVQDMTKMCERAGFTMVFAKGFPAGVFRNENEMVGLFQKQ